MQNAECKKRRTSSSRVSILHFAFSILHSRRKRVGDPGAIPDRVDSAARSEGSGEANDQIAPAARRMQNAKCRMQKTKNEQLAPSPFCILHSQFSFAPTALS